MSVPVRDAIAKREAARKPPKAEVTKPKKTRPAPEPEVSLPAPVEDEWAPS